MLRTTVLERGRVVRADTGTEAVGGTAWDRVLPRRLFDRLMRWDEAHEGVFSQRRGRALVGSWVGVVQIPGLQLEILPKSVDAASPDVDDLRRNLLTMLGGAGLSAAWRRGTANLATRTGTMHNQLVDAFLDRVLFELTRGLDRGYDPAEENLTTLRGKLVLSRHVARNAAQRHRFYCRFDELSEGTPVGVRLKQACRAIGGRKLPAPVQVKQQRALAMLEDVPEVPYRRGGPAPVFTRQNQRFEDVFDFATLLLEGQASQPMAGEVDTFSLLFDMETVFEGYVAHVLARDVVPRLEGVGLHAQGRGHRLGLYRDGGAPVLKMKPDLLFTRGSERLVIDTKWKRLGKSVRPSDADLYQLYAYLNRYGCKRALLLYPKVAGVEVRDLDAFAKDAESIGSVGVRFVSLSGKLWTRGGQRALADELNVLVRTGLDLPSSEQKASA